MNRAIAAALLAGALALGAAACGDGYGDSGETTPTDTTEETTTTGETTDTDAFAAGREIFLSNCGSCHTLADAGTTGTVGPDLDSVSPSFDTVETQVREGGGQMPSFADELTDDEIAAVAEYVSRSTQG
jgi:mono/diheme cytochrome c family protein